MWGMWESNPLNKPNQLLDITNTRIGGKNRRTSTLIIYIISTLNRFLSTNLKYYNTEYTSTYMAGYILNDYLNGKIISLEKKMKDILKMKDSDFTNLMTMNLNHCLTVYQGKIKRL